MCSSNRKSRVARAGHVVGHLDMIDARGSRTVTDRALESFDRFRLAFSRCFDAAVWKIANPARQALAARRGVGEIPEAHALHAAADEKSSSDPHTRKEPVS